GSSWRSWRFGLSPRQSADLGRVLLVLALVANRVDLHLQWSTRGNRRACCRFCDSKKKRSAGQISPMASPKVRRHFGCFLCGRCWCPLWHGLSGATLIYTCAERNAFIQMTKRQVFLPGFPVRVHLAYETHLESVIGRPTDMPEKKPQLRRPT